MEVIDKIKDLFIKDEIGEPPWEYDFLVNLDPGLYPLYLKKIFKYRTGEDLPIKKVGKDKWIIDKNKCKTFNQKTQWIKLHGVTPLMRDLTDKVKVRDYVKEKIGEEYLKPALQIISKDKIYIHPLLKDPSFKKLSNDELIAELDKNKDMVLVQDNMHNENLFDCIDFDKLPNAFVMKCNHGSKWQYIIKDKEQFLNTHQLLEIVKRNMTGWLEQEFFPWNGFEMQYKLIDPKILIESYIAPKVTGYAPEIQMYCFNGMPKFIVRFNNQNEVSIYDENLEITEDVIGTNEKIVNIQADSEITLKEISLLSSKLANPFNFVRVDWMIYSNKTYFGELTFTPYSGFLEFKNKKYNLKFGKWLDLS